MVEQFYIVNATGIQVITSKLTGIIPAVPEESIKFYNAWNLIWGKTPQISQKEFIKISTLVRKKRHYYIFQSITRVQAPEHITGFREELYSILLGRGKIDDVVRGFLYYSKQDFAIVMGIWPTENRKRYEMTDEDERQNLFLSDLKEFQKPKLWEEVYYFFNISLKI